MAAWYADALCNVLDQAQGEAVRSHEPVLIPPCSQSPSGITAMRITVAVCTWNRARLRDQTLAAMRQLQVPAGVEWELLVVNNNCTDATDDVIERHSTHLPIRRLFEVKQGHSHARNRAVAEATGELIVWTGRRCPGGFRVARQLHLGRPTVARRGVLRRADRALVRDRPAAVDR